MPFDLAGIMAITAFLWTIWQQHQLNQICDRCPYLPANKKKEKAALKTAI